MFPNRSNNSLFRFIINHLHLWSGLISSIILFIVCVTGTIYVFKAEIETFIEPNKYKVKVPDIAIEVNLQKMVNFTEKVTNGKASRITVYADRTKPLEIQIHKDRDDKRGLTHFVNPYKDEILGNAKGPASSFFFWIFRLHRWLLMDSSIGRPIVGTATVIFVILSFTGFILWFPKQWKKLRLYKTGFKIKRKTGFKRLMHDLHKVLGFYVLPFILIMSLTGLCWSFDWYKKGAKIVLGAPVFSSKISSNLKSTSLDKANIVSLQEILAISNKSLNYEGKTIITLPKGEDGVFEIKKINTNNFNQDAIDNLIIDQYNGEILKKELFSDKTIGEKISGQIHSLHMGTTYGLVSKILYFIACLIATTLPITGVIIWIGKLNG